MLSNATSPAAARTPAWRMPPPTILRQRLASSMKSLDPTRTDPTGQLRALDRQKLASSTSRVNSATGTSIATAALKIRAPSK